MGEKQIDESDQSVDLRELYPDAYALLRVYPSLEAVKSTCVVALDSSVLLYPYRATDAELLSQCSERYEELASQSRLLVPGHALREYAKNRSAILVEVISKVRDNPSLKSLPNAVISALDGYQDVEKAVAEVQQATQKLRAALQRLDSHVDEWDRDDPVLQMYSEVFTKDVVYDPDISMPDIQTDYARRVANKIPPGYKDGAKATNATGDLIVWETLLRYGAEHQCDMLFVTEDVKSDWVRPFNHKSLFARPELRYEYASRSGGHSFHLRKFSEFLDVFGAEPETVKAVEQDEQAVEDSSDSYELAFRSASALAAKEYAMRIQAGETAAKSLSSRWEEAQRLASEVLQRENQAQALLAPRRNLTGTIAVIPGHDPGQILSRDRLYFFTLLDVWDEDPALSLVPGRHVLFDEVESPILATFPRATNVRLVASDDPRLPTR